MIFSLKLRGFFDPQLLGLPLLAFLTLSTMPVKAETLQGEVKEKSAASQSPRQRVNDSGQGADPFSSGEQTNNNAPAHLPNDSDPFSDTPQSFTSGQNGRHPDATGGSGGAVRRNVSPAQIVRSAPPGNNLTRVVPLQNHGLHSPSPRGTASGTAANSLNAASASLEPENSPAMQLQWDAWHKRVAQDIYFRFNIMAPRQFRTRAPMLCRVSYVITRSGEVKDVRVLQSSNNKAFDRLVTSVIEATVHKNVLRFPPQSQRQTVERTGTFTMNQTSQAGFESQGGDRETIHR